MRKMVLRMSAGIGMDTTVFYHVPEQYTKEFLSDYAWQSAVDWAESFGLEPYPDYEDSLDPDSAWQSDRYTDDIEGYFEAYSPEKHDGLQAGGGSIKWQEI